MGIAAFHPSYGLGYGTVRRPACLRAAFTPYGSVLLQACSCLELYLRHFAGEVKSRWSTDKSFARLPSLPLRLGWCRHKARFPRRCREPILPQAFRRLSVTAARLAQCRFQLTPLSECMSEFLPLRQEAQRRGQLIKETSARHASAAEACKLLGEFATAEVKMLKYVQAKSTVCGISSNILDQLNTGHRHTVEMQTRICTAATQKRAPEGTVTMDFGDPTFKDSSGLFKMAPESPPKEGAWIGDPPLMR